MRLPWRRAALLAGLAVATLAAVAAPTDELLEPDAAFRPSARLVASSAGRAGAGIAIEYGIAPGYYLYRDRMRFDILPADLAVGTPEFPPAEPVDDPFLGRTEIYRGRVTVWLPLAESVADPQRHRVRITAQGCAEDRFCYSPFKQVVPIGAASQPR